MPDIRICGECVLVRGDTGSAHAIWIPWNLRRAFAQQAVYVDPACPDLFQKKLTSEWLTMEASYRQQLT